MGYVLEVRNITKRYPGVVALDNVSLAIEKGEIHALMGENGAGKSTLINVIAGAVSADDGEVVIDGITYKRLTPAQSRYEGIGVIYQEFNLISSLSIVENIFLGEKVGNSRFVPNKKEMYRRAKELMKMLGCDVNPDIHVDMLSTAQQQLVEIAKAVSRNCKVLIMDEPTAVIAVAEVEHLFKIVRKLREKGVTIVYISHRMDEIFELCDRISILRDGQYISTRNIKDVSRNVLIRDMVGREVVEKFPVRETGIGETVMEVKNLTGNGDHDINFSLHKGEILGFAGLVGAGRTELAKMLCGDVKPVSGEIFINGKPIKFRNVSSAVDAGIALIPEDRKGEGLLLDYSVEWNISSMSFKRISRFGIVNQREVDRLSNKYINKLHIKTPGSKQYVRNLSGGNQQKVVVAKTLSAKASIFIFDEPTRGIDVGAKQEIYKLMNEIAKEGNSIIMISSEIGELMGMSDRMIILYKGRIAGCLEKNEFSQARFLELASGED